jgi:hypothetical protein
MRMNRKYPRCSDFKNYNHFRFWTQDRRFQLWDNVSIPPPSVEVDADEEYQVSNVEDSRVYQNQLQYLIRWTGYDSLAWEPVKFMDGLQAVEEIYQ